MTRKIFYSILSVAAAVLLACIVIIMGVLYSYFEEVRANGLKAELEFAVVGVEEGGSSYLKNLEKIQSNRCRLTWIAADGTVLYDTVAGAENKENHGGRAEVRSALETGEGWSSRYSDTLLEKTMYYARRMADGTVLRISVGSATVGLLALGMLQPIVIVTVAAFVLSAVFAHRLSKRIVEPLNKLDLENPLENDTYEEVAPLLRRIHGQHKEIENQFEELQKRADEFSQITASMKEGLVLTDRQGTVLAVNPAADAVFAQKQDCVGKDFLTVCRDREVGICMEAALESGHSEMRQTRAGRAYQFTFSRIDSEGACIGAVLLVFDITERVLAEQARREFTANVSHELKTPLQGILGSAELIENGMVKAEDLPRFTGHIRKEAARLVTLVEDIIRLSQLDEKAEFTKEPVDLYAVAEEAADSLRDVAEGSGVEVRVGGTPQEIAGVRKLVYEIIYNLIDNAIKYNRRGGTVDVTVTGADNQVILTVSDTGIGIPREHIDRVFERFYRVDKSHSRETGGTGLGLSIVKHAVACHRGNIRIQSEVNQGTKIQVEFPR